MKNILIINTMGLFSHGGRAVIKGTIESLQQNIPDVNIDLMSTHYRDEYAIYEKWNYRNVKLIDHIWYKDTNSFIKNILLSSIYAPLSFLRFISYRCFHKVLPIKNPYDQYDIIIDLSTDGLNDHYGLFMPIFFMYNDLLAIISGKKIMVSSASIGKFNRPITKIFSKLILNKVDLISAREDITKEYLLKDLEIDHPRIVSTADQAFLMEPTSDRRIDEILLAENINKDDRPIIGISPSKLIHKYAFPNIIDKDIKYEEYVVSMTKIIDHITKNLGWTVVLIPHSLPTATMGVTRDDFSTSKEIYDRVMDRAANKDKLRLITGKYDADELKGIMSKCDMFIGCRMHSTIASTSTMVPTIAVVYGHKFHGIIGKMLGQEKCIVEIEKCTPEEFSSEMKSKIDYVWINRTSISDELKEKIKVIKEMAFSNGKFAKELLYSKR